MAVKDEVVLTSAEFRDKIAALLRADLPIGSYEDTLPSVESIDEQGAIKLMVIDSDANCFRVTVEQI